MVRDGVERGGTWKIGKAPIVGEDTSSNTNATNIITFCLLGCDEDLVVVVVDSDAAVAIV